jgi:hypothetical protein
MNDFFISISFINFVMSESEEKLLQDAWTSVHLVRARTRSLLESWASQPQATDMLAKQTMRVDQALNNVVQNIARLPIRLNVPDPAPGKIHSS